MLPASFQTPAALLLVVGGLLSCFAGYRIFRIVLGIYGFILGALLASSAMGTDQTLWMIVAAVVGGLVGALILIAAYFVGVALIGAGIGALVANVVAASLGREPHIFVLILLAVVGALAALALQRYVIIVSTAFGGAWTAIVGALALKGDRVASQAAAHNDVWLAYPLNPAPGQRWVILVWLALGAAGLIAQLSTPEKRKKK
ncbi:MAG TPA: DUF4203 domain-containing protein [Vicinamibacterales bacterium]|jgi:Domain of unknown function (DUF4203)|nr:DUF4203 domain-containing protein [Vicinamibacterales bacterium]